MNKGPSSATSSTVQTYRYQLDQVLVALTKDPNNESLKNLAAKLRSLIALVDSATNQTPSNLSSAHHSSVSEKGSDASVVYKQTLSEPDISKVSSSAQHGAVDHLPAIVASSGTKHLQKFKTGETCEARCKHDGQWYEAVVQSISPEYTTLTVVFSGGVETQHCIAKEIRKLTAQPKKKTVPAEPLPPAVGYNFSGTSINDGGVVINRGAVSGGNMPSNPTTQLGATTNKRKHSKAEHQQKKEHEHREKQDSWRQFNAKLVKTNMSATFKAGLRKESIFSKPEAPPSKHK